MMIKNGCINFLLAILCVFQYIGSGVVITQHWTGKLSTTAYTITDNHGCVPYHGLDYLTKGARSRAFKIIQTIELLYIGLLYFGGCNGDSDVGNDTTLDYEFEGEIGKMAKVVLLPLILIPVMVYEIIIATKGSPVVISGNCMLVELDPKLGFLDSEISTFWKVLVGMTGL